MALKDFEEWQAAEQRLIELQLQLTKIEDEYSAGMAAYYHNQALRESEKLDKEAEDFLEGTPRKPTVEEVQLQNIDRRRKVVCRAIEIHRKRMASLRMELSKEIAQNVRPEYAALVKEMAKGAIALARLAEKETAFRDSLFQGDINFVSTFSACPLRGFGRLDDPCSRISMFLAEAVRDGYLRESEIEVLTR